MHNVMKNILRFIFILFLIFLSLPIFSRSYAFRGLSVTEGLSDLVVNAIYKDSLGYVWLGTGNSLECFDGIHFYNPQIQISAESETKRSIFREKDKTKRSKKESAQHSKSRNKSFVMTSVSAL